MPCTVDLVFTGPPDLDGPRLIEIESPPGHSVRVGSWLLRPDGQWVLRLDVDEEEIGAAPDEGAA